MPGKREVWAEQVPSAAHTHTHSSKGSEEVIFAPNALHVGKYDLHATTLNMIYIQTYSTVLPTVHLQYKTTTQNHPFILAGSYAAVQWSACMQNEHMFIFFTRKRG